MSYSDAKIYRILVGGSYYIGSTTMTLEKRLESHKYMSKRRPGMKVYEKIAETGWDSVTIELVESFPCDTFQQLLKRENEFIKLEDPLCLNSRPSFLTDSERKSREKQQAKEYRAANLDKIRERAKTYRAAKPPLTEEEREARRKYHREYMRKRRADLRLKNSDPL